VEANPFRISVVIPAYNESKRITQAIAAIRAQSEPPYEIVVVDDGSQDDTAAVASNLGTRVIRQPNGGVASARNTGIRQSMGDWIAFCDADDHWNSQMLALARTAHELRPDVDFIFADHCTEIGGTITGASRFAACPAFQDARGRRLCPAVLFFEREPLARALAAKNFIAPSAAFVRRDFVMTSGVFFDPDLPSSSNFSVAEDIEWYLRVLKVSNALAIDRVMMTYHRHAGSMSDNPGRINYGNVKLGELIAEHPERYPAGLAGVYAAHRRQHVYEAAVDDLRTQRYATAREKLAEAQTIRFRFFDVALVALAQLAEMPGAARLAAAARQAWRGLKPAIRAIGRRAP
jgi:glycosyltransferase involved in cell wall biosynthesis